MSDIIGNVNHLTSETRKQQNTNHSPDFLTSCQVVICAIWSMVKKAHLLGPPVGGGQQRGVQGPAEEHLLSFLLHSCSAS